MDVVKLSVSTAYSWLNLPVLWAMADGNRESPGMQPDSSDLNVKNIKNGNPYRLCKGKKKKIPIFFMGNQNLEMYVM